MKKRGQFFLIASLIIVAIVLSLGTVYNYATVQKEDTQVFDLSKELGYEGASVIDSGVFTSHQGNIPAYLSDLIGNYSASAPDSDFWVVYGNATTLLLFNASNNCGSVGVGGTSVSVCTRHLNSNYITASGNNVTVTLDGTNYTFQLEEGQNFYIVVKRVRNGEIYIAKT